MERGWQICPRPSSFSFLNILKTKKGMILPFYDLFWTFLPNFSRKFWLAHELLWFCQRGTEKIQKNFVFNFFNFFFFSKQAFLQNVLSIHYVEVVNMIFLLVFKYKYIRIGNFVVFSIRKYGTYFRYIFLFTL